MLDGGLATELERRGHDLSGGLWSARLLDDDPAAIVAVHADYLRAGARVLTTASYQTVDPQRALRSVRLARRAIEETGIPASVAGSVGPYGATLADGSEYTGAYPAGVDPAALASFHHERMAVLAGAADLLACETVPSRAEAEVLVRLLVRLGVPGWLSLTTVTTPDGAVLTRRGEPATEAFALARGVPEVVAVGVNCTDPAGVEAAVAVAAAASGKPVLAYPNSGERWDAATRTWRGRPGLEALAVHRWLAAGAGGVGGCCRVGPDTIAALARAVRPH